MNSHTANPAIVERVALTTLASTATDFAVMNLSIDAVDGHYANSENASIDAVDGQPSKIRGLAEVAP